MTTTAAATTVGATAAMHRSLLLGRRLLSSRATTGRQGSDVCCAHRATASLGGPLRVPERRPQHLLRQVDRVSSSSAAAARRWLHAKSFSSSSSASSGGDAQSASPTPRPALRPAVSAAPPSSPPGSSLLVRAGLPFVLFSVLAAWVVASALDGKLKEMEASQGRTSKSVRQAKLEEEQAEIMERIGFIAQQDFDNTKRIKRPHEVLEERRKERERRNAWYRRAWRWATGQKDK